MKPARPARKGASLTLTDSRSVPEDYLEIRGARVHNLKNIDLRLPHNQLIVVTGVSGSGKSSLVFDLIYAEGRRRYVESLSSYARQFLERMEKPDVDEVLGIAPTVAIRQKNTTRNPRSTVATSTEIHDFLRLLFARAGRTFCVKCGQRVAKDAPDHVVREVTALEPGSRWYVLFPVRPEDFDWRALEFDDEYDYFDGPMKARLGQLRKNGFNRLFQSGNIFEFSTPESLLDLNFDEPIHVLVDRIAISPDGGERVADSVEIAYGESGEVCFASATEPDIVHRFSNRFACSGCGHQHSLPEPSMFNLNSPYGACRECKGHGRVSSFAMDLFVTRPDRTLRTGAITPWQGNDKPVKARMLKAARRKGIPTDVPYNELDPEQRRLIEEGWENFEGIRGYLKKLEDKAVWSTKVAARLSQWRRSILCPDCDGSRLSRETLAVRVGGKSLADVLRYSLAEASEFFETLELDGSEAEIAANPLAEIQSRLRFLNDVGLGYLTLDRLSATLSGGEAQRIQLATSLGSRLVGVCYVLDEPSIGLHSRDTAKLIRTLKQLRDIGNTIVVVEHDKEIMLAADHIVDLGPAAGERGGEVVFSGHGDQIHSPNGSLTARYLAGRQTIPVPASRRQPVSGKSIRILGAAKHNLKKIDVKIPIGVLTVISGVSGSGKSTLLHDVVHRGMTGGQHHQGSRRSCQLMDLECDAVTGGEHFGRVVLIDQALADHTSRSVPATYMRIFDSIRSVFGMTEQARQRSLDPRHFSFNTDVGCCPTCNGSGQQTINMQFLADVNMTCEDCGGKRYRNTVLEVEFRGKSIWDVLEMTVREALRLFGDFPRIATRLSVLESVGLEYIRLGQPANQLSGGEAQRLKLAMHIADAETEKTLFLFDEPTTGLHFDDIRRLLRVFDTLIDSGATAVVIEHNLDVIKCADWVIDLGPDGGEKGGRVISAGPPELVAQCEASYTAPYLRKALA